MKNVLMILADGFEEIEAVTVIDILRRADINITTAGLESFDVRGAHDIVITADKLLTDVIDNDFHMIVLPGGGGGTKNLAGSEMVLKLLNKQNNNKKKIAAICAAPIVLDKAGVLTGHEFTSFPATEGEFADAERYSYDDVVISGNITTSRAAGTSAAFALEIVKQIAGIDMARKLAEVMLFDDK